MCAQIQCSFCYTGQQAEITEIYVATDSRRRGIAERLMMAAEDECRKRGARHVRISTAKDNFAAQALYRKLGYDVEKEVFFGKNFEKK